MTPTKSHLAVPMLLDALSAVIRLSQLTTASVPGADPEQLSGLFATSDAFITQNLTAYIGHRFGEIVLYNPSAGAARLTRLDSWMVDENGAPVLGLSCVDTDGRTTGERIQIYLDDCHERLGSQFTTDMEDAPGDLAEAPGM